jgi:hypothetical protein
MFVPYILPADRANYLHFWKRESALLWLHYPDLYPCSRWVKYQFIRRAEHYRTVNHTTVFPDGSTETWEWQSPHGALRISSSQKLPFRKGYSKNVTEPGRSPDSFNREEKTCDYRRNDKVRTRWPQGGSSRTYAVRQQNRNDRRAVKKQINEALKSGNWNQIQDWVDPRDWWMWD